MSEVIETKEERKKRRDKEYQKEYYHANSEKRKERMKEYYQANSEKIKEQQKEQKKAYYQDNKNKVRERTLKRRYGINITEYNQLFTSQEGCCKICRTPQSELKGALAVDHCHTTGKVRGLLCHSCNIGIGMLKDSESLLKAAAKYLKENKGK